jgi:hypothetical protein
MNLVGDANGIAALQELKESSKDYLKFLLQEARTGFERAAEFKSKDGVAYRLSWVAAEQKYVVSRQDEARPIRTPA